MNTPFPMVRLGDVLVSVSRPESVVPDQTYRLLGAHWYAEGLYVKETRLGAQIRAGTLYRVEREDFVYNRLFAWKGSFAVATDEDDGCYVSNEFPCFTVRKDRTEPRYLWRYFSRAAAWDEALGLSTGGTPTSRNRLKEEKFLRMYVPLPPLDEQRRIVARIEALAAKIEEARELRRQAAEEMGRLKARYLESALSFDAWPTVLLGNLLRENSLNGLSTRPSEDPPGIPILRISAATSRDDWIVDESDFKFLEGSADDQRKYALLPGDLLACRFNGNLHYVGRFALYTSYHGDPQVYPDKLIRFRVDTGKVLPQFVCLAMNSPRGRAIIEALCSTTAGNIGISATSLKTVPIPVPSLIEQQGIVDRLNVLQVHLDSVMRLHVTTTNQLDALLPSILDRAFKGEL